MLRIRFSTWNAVFRNRVTVGNQGGCAISLVARGSSNGASRYSLLYGRHSGLLGVPITMYWWGCGRFSLSSLIQRGGVKLGTGGLFSWFSSPGIKGNGRGDDGVLTVTINSCRARPDSKLDCNAFHFFCHLSATYFRDTSIYTCR